MHWLISSADREKIVETCSKYMLVKEHMLVLYRLLLLLNEWQARIHTGFHRFTKIGQSFHKEVNFS